MKQHEITMSEVSARTIVNCDHEYTQALTQLITAANHLRTIANTHPADREIARALFKANAAVHHMAKVRQALNDATHVEQHERVTA